MSLVFLAALTVLVVAYLLTPSIRERFFALSPLSSVGMWKRGMSAISPEGRRGQRQLKASAAHPALIPPDLPRRRPDEARAQMRVHHGQREILVPQGRLEGAGLRPGNDPSGTGVPYTAPLEEHPSNPWDVVTVPPSPAQRRQMVQFVLGGLTAIFAIAGFFVAQLWILSVLCLLLLLGYVALAHEVRRRNHEVDRARKMAQLRGRPPEAARAQRRPRARTRDEAQTRQPRTSSSPRGSGASTTRSRSSRR